MYYFAKSTNAVYDDFMTDRPADCVEVPNTLYSPGRRGFYPPALYDVYCDAGSWPADLYPVTAAEEAEIRVVLNTPPPLTPEQQATANAAEKTRLMSLCNEQISVLTDATDPDIVDPIKPSDVALLVEWKKYRQLVRNINSAALPVTWPAQPELAYGARA